MTEAEDYLAMRLLDLIAEAAKDCGLARSLADAPSWRPGRRPSFGRMGRTPVAREARRAMQGADGCRAPSRNGLICS